MASNDVAHISEELANLALDGGDDHQRQAPFAGYESEPPPVPKLYSQGVIAMDITQQFTKAARELKLGQLVKDPHFTLFEAVGALEIMDHKMDSGYLGPGETMEDEYDFGQALLPEEIIGIIDQLLCHEMAWHMGYPLSQTLFTSLYIDRILMPAPLSLEQTLFDRGESSSDEEPLGLKVLRAYCIGLIKTCWFVNTRVKAEHFYEEEDFVTHTYNRSLLEAIDHDVIIRFLEDTATLLTANDDIAPEIKSALLCRLEFRTKFLKTVEMADSRTSPELKQLWTDVLDFPSKMKSFAYLGKPFPSSFSIKIQRRLASTVPPRPIVQVSQEAAFDHLECLCRDGSVVVEVLRYYDSQSLMTFVSLFQARKPQPSVYIRTILQYYLFGDMTVLGTMSIRQILDEDLAATTLPGSVLLDRGNDEIEVPSDPRFNMACQMEIFRSRAAGSYLDILRTFCQNRCRIRRTLCHTITDWDNLQLDSEELDQELRVWTKEEPIMDKSISDDPIHAFPLSSWVYYYKLRQMEWIVQMGFELETYQSSELSGMYWYLQYLAKTRSRHLERIRGFILRSRAVYGRDKTNGAAKRQQEVQKAISFVNFSTMEAAATYGFADAISCLYTVLGRLSILPTLPQPYSDDSLRYEVRMKPFSTIGLPELISFDELNEFVANPDESIMKLLEFAEEYTAGAKKAFEIISKLSPQESFCQGSHESWLKNVKNCLKSCIFASITIATVKKAFLAAGKDGKVKLKIEIPPPGKGYHDWWVLPKATLIS